MANLSDWLGNHYNNQAWSGSVRQPDGADLLEEPITPEALATVDSFLDTNEIILSIGGLGSARDETLVADYMDWIESDDGVGWKTEVYDKVILIDATAGDRHPKVYWQIGNEINSEGYSRTIGAWAPCPHRLPRMTLT